MSSMKLDWKKSEKAVYLPGAEPELSTIPAFKFFALRGQGNPNSDAFQDYVGVLYSLSYAVRMSYKSPDVPAGFQEYTVYPLEGVWDISDEAKKKAGAAGMTAGDGKLDKDSLTFQLMMRQPDFVTAEFASLMIDKVRRKKPQPLLESVEFMEYAEGLCIQMMHHGSFDEESSSFARMEAFCQANALVRTSKRHREIYLSDPRTTESAKLKTVLRFQAGRG